MFNMKRTFSKGRVLIALFSALLLLQRPVSQNTTKTSASAAYWQETTTIESGKKYIISVISSYDTTAYYLKPDIYSNSPGPYVLDIENATPSAAWTFTETSENVYLISDNNDHHLYYNNTGTGLRALKVEDIPNTHTLRKFWTYDDNRLTTNYHDEKGIVVGITHYADSKSNYWRPYQVINSDNNFTQTLKLYTLTDAGEANNFGTKFLSMTDGECNDKNVLSATWDEIEEMYNNTSFAVKTLINSAIPNVNGSDLEHALVRYNHIVAAYGYADFLNLTNNQAIKVTNPPQNSILPNVIMISTIGISVTLGYYFILKKTIKE